MPSYPKRKEGTLVKACLSWLQCQENSGHIIWCDRLNSGNLTASYTSKRTQVMKWRRIRMCRVGTADIYAIMRSGAVLWIECKKDVGNQSEEQLEFQRKISSTPNHHYIVVRDMMEVVTAVRDLLIEG